MTHAASFGTVAVLVLAARRWHGPHGYTPATPGGSATPRRPRLPDAAAGGLFADRAGDARRLGAARGNRRSAGRRRLARCFRRAARRRRAVAAAAGAAQHVLMRDQRLPVVRAAGLSRSAGDSRWLDTLFSSWHGLLSWTPIVYVAVAGTVALAVRRRAAGRCSALVLLVAMAWINGSTTDWAAGWSFGGRRFTSVLVMLAPGLALVVEAALRRPQVLRRADGGGGGRLELRPDGAVHRRDGAQGRTGELRRGSSGSRRTWRTRSPFVYPFAFPANVWFAWREGLPVDRYDLLADRADRRRRRDRDERAGPSASCSTAGTAPGRRRVGRALVAERVAGDSRRAGRHAGRPRRGDRE